MVLKPQNDSENKSFEIESPEDKRYLAFPLDRLAAFFVDLFVVLASVGLLLAPVKKHVHTLQLLNETVPWIVFIAMYGTAFLIAVLYFSLGVYFKGCTIGKRLFDIYIVSYEQEHPITFWQSVLRTLVLFFDVLLVFPLFAIYGHSNRRPAHDRIADTIVVSRGERFSAKPNWVEKSFVRTSLWLVVILALTFLYTEVVKWKTTNDGKDWFTQLELVGKACETVGAAQKTWPLEKGATPSRIQVALALFGAGTIDQDCLQSEIDHSFLGRKQQELSYLASSFTRSENPSISNKYLEKVCEVDMNSEACQFTELVQLWSEKKWQKADEMFEKLLGGASIYVKIWAIRHFERTKDFEKELALIEALWPIDSLAEFFETHKTVALWGMQQVEPAEMLAKMSYAHLDDATRTEFAASMCMQETQAGCYSLSMCKVFRKNLEQNISLLAKPSIAVGFLEMAKCEKTTDSDDTKELVVASQDSELQKLYQFIVMQKENKLDDARAGLKEYLEGNQEPGLQVSAYLQLLTVSNSIEEIDSVREEWESMDPYSWNWRYLGNKLLSRYSELQNSQGVYLVGHAMLESRYAPEVVYKMTAVAAAELGQEQEALTTYKKWQTHFAKNNVQKENTDTSASRAPASQNESLEKNYSDKFNKQLLYWQSLKESKGE